MRIEYQCSNVPSTEKSRRMAKLKETAFGLGCCAIVAALVVAVLWGAA